MLCAVFSDVHGNLEAFTAVLKDLRQQQPDVILCLGDNIGYGPDPEEVMKLIHKHNIKCVLGNHEMALISREIRDWFNPQAKQNVKDTRKLLSSQSKELIKAQPTYFEFHGGYFVHGFPPDSMTTYLYMVPDEEVQLMMHNEPYGLFFLGHTHELMLVYEDDDLQLVRKPLVQGTMSFDVEKQYIVNVGSVGQPRDGDNRAKYILWDTEQKTVEVRCVAYDIQTTVNKILDRGFPKAYANRLW